MVGTGNSTGPGMAKALEKNPAGLKKWIKLSGRDFSGDDPKPAESVVEGATPDSIAAFSESLKASKKSAPTPKRKWRPWRR